MVQKESVQTLTFTGIGCAVTITDQVVFDIDVLGGRQTVNFPVTQLAAVKVLLDAVAADEDVLAVIAANTPVPEEPAE